MVRELGRLYPTGFNSETWRSPEIVDPPERSFHVVGEPETGPFHRKAVLELARESFVERAPRRRIEVSHQDRRKVARRDDLDERGALLLARLGGDGEIGGSSVLTLFEHILGVPGEDMDIEETDLLSVLVDHDLKARAVASKVVLLAAEDGVTT